jgi:hypothetical protein
VICFGDGETRNSTGQARDWPYMGRYSRELATALAQEYQAMADGTCPARPATVGGKSNSTLKGYRCRLEGGVNRRYQVLRKA